jgi:hypothetical protein
VLPSLHKPLPDLSAGRLLKRSHRSVTNGDGPTQWDIAVYDYADVPGLPEKLVCTESPSGTCEPVQKKDLKSSGSLSDSSGSTSFNTTTQLGSLVGSAKASLGMPGPSAQASAENASLDTFTITSSTLPYGTPVSFKATIDVTPPTVHCRTAALINFGASTTYSGLSDEELCSSSPPPVLTATVNTTVGATFTDQVAADLYLDVGNFSVGGKISGAFKVTYHLDRITSGASYLTASGKQYP